MTFTKGDVVYVCTDNDEAFSMQFVLHSGTRCYVCETDQDPDTATTIPLACWRIRSDPDSCPASGNNASLDPQHP